MANGSVAFVRPRCISVVSPLASATSYLGLDFTDHPLDGEHLSYLRHVALAHTWTSLGCASHVGHAVGIRMCGDRHCNARFVADQTIHRTTMLSGSNRVTGTEINFCIREPLRIIKRRVVH